MLVVKGTVPANTFGTNLVTDEFILPADSCVWQSGDFTPNGGYEISDVFFILGGTEVVVSNAELGHIGKSGRFVQYTAT